jgi:hypothetical protein
MTIALITADITPGDVPFHSSYPAMHLPCDLKNTQAIRAFAMAFTCSSAMIRLTLHQQINDDH